MAMAQDMESSAGRERNPRTPLGFGEQMIEPPGLGQRKDPRLVARQIRERGYDLRGKVNRQRRSVLGLPDERNGALKINIFPFEPQGFG